MGLRRRGAVTAGEAGGRKRHIPGRCESGGGGGRAWRAGGWVLVQAEDRGVVRCRGASEWSFGGGDNATGPSSRPARVASDALGDTAARCAKGGTCAVRNATREQGLRAQEDEGSAHEGKRRRGREGNGAMGNGQWAMGREERTAIR